MSENIDMTVKRDALVLRKPILDTSENVTHPKHYNQGKFEVIEIIED
jgi:hypothetical protein